MNPGYRFTNFGDLYRAAFAEPNPTTKQLLLAAVKKALDEWAKSANDGLPAPEMRVYTEVEGLAWSPFGMPRDHRNDLQVYQSKATVGARADSSAQL